MVLNGFHSSSLNGTHQFCGIFQGHILDEVRHKCTYILPRANQLRKWECSWPNGCAHKFLQIKWTIHVSELFEVRPSHNHLDATLVSGGQHQRQP